MIPTYGLTHIALKVQDLDRSSQFYQDLFGAQEMYRFENFIQLQTPSNKDIIVLEKADHVSHEGNSIMHFGFRLVNPMTIDELTAQVLHAGGKIKERGEFVEGEPYIFLFDPDGYEIEIWYELLPENQDRFH